MLPAPLQRLIDEVDATERDAREVLAGLDHARANWQPDEGRVWSVAQCVDHLARINVFYTRAVLPAARDAAARGAGAFTSIAPTWLGRRFTASLEPPVTRRFRTPSPEIVPASTVDPDDVLRAFEASHAGYHELVGLCARFDPNRLRVPNPFFRLVPMRMSTILLVIPAHDRRHVWQARNVRALVDART